MRIRFGAFTFDSRQRSLTRAGARLDLSPKAFLLLQALIESRPAPVAREDLYRRLWPDTFVEPGNLHNLVSEVRAILGDTERQYVATVHRFGYAFVAAGAVEESAAYALRIGGEEIALRQGENVIGRDGRDTIVIHAPEVSRHHARLVVEGDQITIEDLRSKNGTFVGTKRVDGKVCLAPGDEIVIGKTRLQLAAVERDASTATLL